MPDIVNFMLLGAVVLFLILLNNFEQRWDASKLLVNSLILVRLEFML